jgi:hypothetical protein
VIPNEVMASRNGIEMIDRAADIKVTLETMRFRCAGMIGAEFPLVFWRGAGRIVDCDAVKVSVLVRGMRTDLTWDRVGTTWVRLLSNHTLTVDELGGGADAVGLVSLLGYLEAERLCVLEADGLLMLAETEGVPVHQYADMSLPTSWAPWRRQIHGD